MNSGPPGSALSVEEARTKNIDEYNQQADAYNEWCAKNLLMQRYCYYSTFKEMENEGIEGKTFLEVGCGPCPIGQQLAHKGAKKIFGLDISSEMIDEAGKILTEKGIIDKFELVCADIFDEKFTLSEKVDCVVLSYTITTFINSYEMLKSILQQCSKVIKDDGYVFVADFQWVDIPQDNWWCGMYTKALEEGKTPENFKSFHFFIQGAPNPFEVFHIPQYVMIQAGIEAGMKKVEHQMQYPDPEVKDDPILVRYFKECKPNDYLIKFRFQHSLPSV